MTPKPEATSDVGSDDGVAPGEGVEEIRPPRTWVLVGQLAAVLAVSALVVAMAWVYSTTGDEDQQQARSGALQLQLAVVVAAAAAVGWLLQQHRRRQEAHRQRLEAFTQQQEADRQRREARWRVLRTVNRIRVSAADQELRLPWLGEVDPTGLGARSPKTLHGRARKQLPYAPRDAADEQLRQELAVPGCVLLHGPPAIGKSRAAAEVVITLFADRPIVFPTEDASALQDAIDAGVLRPGVVVWLDDVHDHITALGDRLLEELLRIPDVRIVATIPTERLNDIQTASEGIKPAGYSFITDARKIEYGPRDTAELNQAIALYEGDPEADDVVAAMRQGNDLGSFLSAVPELIAAYATGPPEGRAVVQAVIAWNRAGLTRPAPVDVVRQLYPLQLQADRGDLIERFDHALRWAHRDVSGTRLVRARADESGLTIDDAVLSHLITDLPPGLPEPVWDVIAAEIVLSLDDLVAAAVTAYLTHRDPTRAIGLVRRAADRHDDPRTMVFLGILLAEQGDGSGAEAAYRAVIATDHTDQAPLAMVLLGLLLAEQGDGPGAEATYRAAIATNHPDQAPTAMVDLGNLLKDRGDRPGAEAAYRDAVATSHPDHAPKAMVNLGNLLKERCDERGAEAAYRAAIATGHTDAAPAAMVFLGKLLMERAYEPEHEPDAEAAYRAAIATQHIDEAPKAMVLLGNLLKDRGDNPGAEAAYRAAIATQHTDEAPMAMVFLGILLGEQGDELGAEAAYRAAIATKDAYAVPAAMFFLNVMLKQVDPGPLDDLEA